MVGGQPGTPIGKAVKKITVNEETDKNNNAGGGGGAYSTPSHNARSKVSCKRLVKAFEKSERDLRK